VGFGPPAFTRFASEGWWARQDSNLQPDRYERSTLPRKSEQNQRFSIKIMRIRARLFTGFLMDNR